MLTVFKHTISRSKGAIIGWGLTLALLGLMFVPFYDSIAENSEQFEQLMDIYPEEMMAFFSESGASFTTPEGFLAIEYFSFMPIVLGVYAILAGSGILDLIAAQPISRSALFWGRFAAFALTLTLVLVLGYAGVMLATTYSVMELDPIETIRPFASLFGLLFFFAGLALVLSMVLPSRQSASMVAGIVLVASFFMNGLANLSDTLADVKPFLPHSYYQSENWTAGFETGWFLGLMAVGLGLTLLAWLAFLRRDIRVAGEGGWKLPKLSRLWTRRAAGGMQS